MNKKEQGECLKALREKIGFKKRVEWARVLFDAGAHDNREHGQDTVYRWESGRCYIQDSSLRVIAKLVKRKGFYFPDRGQVSKFVRDIARLPVKVDWMARLDELRHASEAPTKLPIVHGLNHEGNRIYRTSDGVLHVLPTEANVRQVATDTSRASLFVCEGEGCFWVCHKDSGKAQAAFYLREDESREIVLAPGLTIAHDFTFDTEVAREMSGLMRGAKNG